METFKRLSQDVQIVLAASALYLVVSFLDWQQVSFGPVSAGISEWHGIGVLAGLLVVALIVWELARIVAAKIELGPLTPGQVSIGLALLLFVFTLITFVSHNEARHWPAWVGLVLSIVIVVAAGRRARSEGVELPKNIAAMTASSSTAGGAPPAEPAATPDQTHDEPAPNTAGADPAS